MIWNDFQQQLREGTAKAIVYLYKEPLIEIRSVSDQLVGNVQVDLTWNVAIVTVIFTWVSTNYKGKWERTNPRLCVIPMTQVVGISPVLNENILKDWPEL